ncbi:uncharacterized protein N7487_008643 [Penicillium crustosum]|uniref:uncharacterized protein n=1 Tax=Penicillium crustosum TaxID=36656 RepID=UPI00238C07CC|nr:uncharacterized protein N7487_008643 [Penicillium crustosum]KAJ5402747.1 hypothetical protein N7487_008643 [Penicillium crustosum]
MVNHGFQTTVSQAVRLFLSGRLHDEPVVYSFAWPVTGFYNGFNELCEDELPLANIFREKAREDLAMCVVEGRMAQRFFFALGPESSFLDIQTLPYNFAGLKRAFNFEK